MFFTIIIFILVLSLLVFFHEFGHFWTARKFGIKTDEFGFGLPPRAFGIYKDKNNKWKIIKGGGEVKDAVDTVYSVNWLPLGGFVKIKGENGEDAVDADSFPSKKIWQRIVVVSAGVFMNIMLAAFLFSIGYMIGLPQSMDNSIGSGKQVTNSYIQVLQVEQGTPAEEAGIMMGDAILGINGEKFSSVKKVNEFVSDKGGKELNYLIKRGDEMMNLGITPTEMSDGEDGIGVAIGEIGIVKYPWYHAIWMGFKTTFILTWTIIVALFVLLRDLILGSGAGGQVGGPVMIASLTGQFAKLGISYLIQFTAMLSINLAIINFIPIPALDGGRVLFLIIEKIKGSPVKQRVESLAHNIGFIILLILILIVTFNDISRFF